MVLLTNVKMLILRQCIDAPAEDVLAAIARATGECIGVQSSRHTSIAAAGYDVNLFTTDLSSTRIRSAMMSSTPALHARFASYMAPYRLFTPSLILLLGMGSFRPAVICKQRGSEMVLVCLLAHGPSLLLCHAVPFPGGWYV